MDKFKLIEHTADIGLVAYGHDLAEAFANAGYGLFSIIAELDKVRERESKEIEVSAPDIESLLFEWLNRLIFIFDVEHFLFKRFAITEFSEQNIKATGWGEKYDPARHELNTGVKSATYHMLKVDREDNTVQVIFDV